MALDFDEIDRSMTFLPSDGYTISCGTVTLDPPRGKVLLIWNRQLQIYQLPKGRKNIGEDMLSAAVRETYEESGVRVTPVRLHIATRATPSRRERQHHPCFQGDDDKDESMQAAMNGFTPAPSPPPAFEGEDLNPDDSHNNNSSEDLQQHDTSIPPLLPPEKRPEVTSDRSHNEFVAACAYPDPQSSRPAAKTVFYFAAMADSTVEPDLGTQEPWEKLEGVWMPAEEACATLRFRVEAEIVRKAIEDARRSGYVIAA